jgi:hypothetical protein
LLNKCLDNEHGVDYSGYFYLTISKDGIVLDVRILSINTLSGCEDDIIEKLFNMDKWISGKINGICITTHRIIEINYKRAG